MNDLREMYKELYIAINAMPLPTSPDDPESPEPEEYVEPEWMKHFGSTAPNAFEVEYKKALAAQLDPCGRDEDMDQIWLAPEFGAPKRNGTRRFALRCLSFVSVADPLKSPRNCGTFSSSI